jgi:hypothetical protein
MAVTQRHLSARVAGLALAVMALAFPVSAFANTNEPIAQTGGMTVTIPMLGTSLTVAVTLDPVGKISGVALDPTGTLPTSVTGEHGVKFSSVDGTASVQVKAKGDKLAVKARTKTLADLRGSGTWKANVFGAGTEANVGYTIGVDAAGKPTLKIDSATASAGVDVVIKDPTDDKDDHGGKDGKASARATVVFSLNGYSKSLKLSVTVGKDGTAGLTITLSGKDRQKLHGTLEALVGPKTWSAHLCDGTPVSVAYHVTAGGTAIFDSSTGPKATVKTVPHGFTVRFDGTKVRVNVDLKALQDGTWQLKASGKSGQCGSHDGHVKDLKVGNGDKAVATATNASARSHQKARGNGGNGGNGGNQH